MRGVAKTTVLLTGILFLLTTPAMRAQRASSAGAKVAASAGAKVASTDALPKDVYPD